MPNQCSVIWYRTTAYSSLLFTFCSLPALSTFGEINSSKCKLLHLSIPALVCRYEPYIHAWRSHFYVGTREKPLQPNPKHDMNQSCSIVSTASVGARTSRLPGTQALRRLTSFPDAECALDPSSSSFFLWLLMNQFSHIKSLHQFRTSVCFCPTRRELVVSPVTPGALGSGRCAMSRRLVGTLRTVTRTRNQDKGDFNPFLTKNNASGRTRSRTLVAFS